LIDCSLQIQSIIKLGFKKELTMPTIRVELMEGRTPEQKKELAKALTDATCKTLGSKPESVDILFFDVRKHDWATGGVLWSEKT